MGLIYTVTSILLLLLASRERGSAADGVTLLVNIITSTNITRGRYQGMRNFNSENALVSPPDSTHSNGLCIDVKLPQLRLIGPASASITFTSTSYELI